MRTQLPQNNGSVSNVATRYYPFGVGGVIATVQTGTSSVATPMSVAGTVSGATGAFPTALTTGSYTVTLMRSTGGGAFADTSLVGTTSIGSTAITFTGSATVAAGDLLAWKVVPASTPDTQTNIVLTSIFDATTSGKGVILAGGANSNTTKQMQPAAFAAATRTATEVSCPMPAAGVIDRIDLKLTTAPGAGTSKTAAIYKNGASVGTVTVSNTDTQNSASGLAISFAQGDIIRIEETVSGAVAASLSYVCLDWTPTTNGEAVTFGSQVSGQSTSSASFGFLSGTVGNGTGSATTYPELVAADCTAKKLAAVTDVTPGVGKSRTVSLVKGGVSQSLAAAADTTPGVDNTNTVALTAGDAVTIQNLPSGTPTGNGSTLWGMVLVSISPPSSGGGGGLMLLGVG